jgi:hypothetical protein
VSDLSATRALPCAGTRDQPISLQASSLLRVWRASSPAAREVLHPMRLPATIRTSSAACTDGPRACCAPAPLIEAAPIGPAAD